MHQIRFLLPREELTAPPWPLAGGEGDWLHLPLLEQHGTQCREAAKYVLISCTSKKHIRSFIGGVPATGTLCFCGAARPLAEI